MDHYGDQYPPPQRPGVQPSDSYGTYQDTTPPAGYDPFNARSHPQPGYSETSFYRDDAGPAVGEKQVGGMSDTAAADFGHRPSASMGGMIPPPKSTGDLRIWRHEEHANVWTKGSRGRCCGRFFCCTLMITLLFIVSIVCTLGLWIRPPDITFKGILTNTNGSTVTVTATDLQISLFLDMGVTNPNYFDADFTKISAQIFYPISPTNAIGGGSVSNIVFKAHSNTDFMFPFTIDYTTAADPNQAIIKDIVNKCGFVPGTSQQDISVKYSIKLGIKIVAFTVSPTFSGTASFKCPITEDEIKALSGIDITGILGGSAP